MLRDFGVHWVLVGHSERRHDPLVGPESDELVAHKANRAASVGLRVVACVGETAEERAAGKAIRVITRQLAAVAQEVSQWEHIAIAYEPVRL
jgi:triosephosphate isomerase